MSAHHEKFSKVVYLQRDLDVIAATRQVLNALPQIHILMSVIASFFGIFPQLSSGNFCCKHRKSWSEIFITGNFRMHSPCTLDLDFSHLLNRSCAFWEQKDTFAFVGWESSWPWELLNSRRGGAESCWARKVANILLARRGEILPLSASSAAAFHPLRITECHLVCGLCAFPVLSCGEAWATSSVDSPDLAQSDLWSIC